MVAFIVGMFVLWYVYMYGGAGNDKLSRVPDVLGETSAEAERVLKTGNSRFGLRERKQVRTIRREPFAVNRP